MLKQIGERFLATEALSLLRFPSRRPLGVHPVEVRQDKTPASPNHCNRAG